MRTRPSSTSAAFTLIEIITAMAIILVLTGLVIQISGYVTRRGSVARAQGEIAAIAAACESYKAESGGYPMDIVTGGTPGVTDELKPKEHFVPTAAVYEKANIFLYKELTGDKKGSGTYPDGKPDDDEPRYLKEFDVKMLKVTKDANNKITEVRYIQDPWGYPYGYSTAAAREEMKYQQELKTKGKNAARPSADSIPGFNGASYDLWSTGGSRPSSSPGDKTKKDLEWAKWVKNW